MKGRHVTFEWVKGHAGHRMNERADDLARACAEAYQAGRTPKPGPGFGGGASGSRGSASAGQEPGRATSAPAAPASVEPHDEATISDAPTNASRDDAADESTTSTFRSHPSVFSAPTEASEPAEAAPTSSVSTPTTKDAIAREREFILAWTGGDERALATMTDERTTRIWPGGGATTTLGGPSPASPSIGRIDMHDVGGAFLARYRVRWEGGASLESSVWAPATSGEARLVMVHHQSTLIS